MNTAAGHLPINCLSFTWSSLVLPSSTIGSVFRQPNVAWTGQGINADQINKSLSSDRFDSSYASVNGILVSKHISEEYSKQIWKLAESNVSARGSP